MQCTSAEAAKMIRQLKEELRLIIQRETLNSVFCAAVGEDPETLRPPYDYGETQKQIREIQARIRKIKHALNLFNSSQKVDDMTIDEVLVYLPQLQELRDKLARMSGRSPKQRANAYHGFGKLSTVIDYEYANYDISTVEDDYRKVCLEIGRLQGALDLVNSTVMMEVDL